jgi:flagellar motor switch protein FliM
VGDILSQAEIDALLNQLTSGGDAETIITPVVDVKDARRYDFANPNKFNKDQLRTLENIFDNYARQVSSFLTGYLRTATTLEVASSEQIMYRDFNVALSNPAVLAMVEFHPLKGTVIVDMSTNIAYAIIDRILGGPGFGLKKLRDFSEIEKILLERVILQMLNYLPEPWENVLTVKPRLEKIETNSQFAQIIGPTEMVALVVLSIKVGSSEGTINICLPHLVMEPIMDKLYTKFWYIQRDEVSKENYRGHLEDQLERTLVPVTALVGKTNIMVTDFINLQVGDIIKLDSYYNSDMRVMVGNMLKFNAKPGISRGKNAIQITSLIEKEAYLNG